MRLLLLFAMYFQLLFSLHSLKIIPFTSNQLLSFCNSRFWTLLYSERGIPFWHWKTAKHSVLVGNGSENNVKITICSFKEIEKSPIMFHLMNMKINQLYSNSSTYSCVYFAVYTWALVCKSLTPLISVLVFWSCNSFCTSDNIICYKDIL